MNMDEREFIDALSERTTLIARFIRARHVETTSEDLDAVILVTHPRAPIVYRPVQNIHFLHVSLDIRYMYQ